MKKVSISILVLFASIHTLCPSDESEMQDLQDAELTCSQCGTEYTTQEGLAFHMQSCDKNLQQIGLPMNTTQEEADLYHFRRPRTINAVQRASIQQAQQKSADQPNQEFYCPYCKTDNTFNSKDELIQHYQDVQHLKMKSFSSARHKEEFRCPFCGAGAVYQQEAKDHENLHTRKNIYACKKCPTTTYDRTYFLQHKKKHQKNEKNDGIASKKKRAQKNSSPIFSFPAIEPPPPSPNSANQSRSATPTIPACCLCNFQAGNPQELINHAIEHLESENPLNTSEPIPNVDSVVITCHYEGCNFATTDNRFEVYTDHLKTHRQASTTTAPISPIALVFSENQTTTPEQTILKCPYYQSCDFTVYNDTFATAALIQHLQDRHLPQPTLPIPSNISAYNPLSDQLNLNEAENLQEENNTTLATETFNTQTEQPSTSVFKIPKPIRKRKSVHDNQDQDLPDTTSVHDNQDQDLPDATIVTNIINTPEVPTPRFAQLATQGYESFICQLCEYKASSKRSLDDHIRECKKKKTYICTQCPQTFHSIQDLEDHTNAHNGTPQHICLYCKRPHYFLSTYKNHIKRCPQNPKKR